MESSVKITLIKSATVLIILLAIAAFYFSIKPSNTVNANGVAEIEVMPDVTALYFYIETEAATATLAKDLNSEVYDEFLLALIKEGFDRDEIETQSYNVRPYSEWEDDEYVEKGYKAEHRIRVKMDTEDTSKIGEAIDAGVNNGALLQYMNFELSQEKENEYKAEALKQATQDARIKAESIAEGLNKRVGRLVSVSTSDFDYRPWRMYEASVDESAAVMKESAVSIQPSKQTINARVSVRYTLR